MQVETHGNRIHLWICFFKNFPWSMVVCLLKWRVKMEDNSSDIGLNSEAQKSVPPISEELPSENPSPFEDSTPLLNPNQAKDEVDELPKDERPCPECGGMIPASDTFCSGCGFVMKTKEQNSRELLAKERELNVLKRESKKSARIIIILAILFAVFGTLLGFLGRTEANKAKAMIANMKETDTLPVNGKVYTIKELRKKLDMEVYVIFGTNYLLSIIMFGLYVWARRNLFPAIISAFCIYMAVIAGNAFIDPKTLVTGILFKIIFIMLFIAGIKKALKVRELSGSLKDRV
jgi:predicted nucleic acid-binding Zn ribbon protein